MSNLGVSIVQPAGGLYMHGSRLPFLLVADFPPQLLFGLQPWPCILNAASFPIIHSPFRQSHNWIELFRNVRIRLVEYLISKPLYLTLKMIFFIVYLGND